MERERSKFLQTTDQIRFTAARIIDHLLHPLPTTERDIILNVRTGKIEVWEDKEETYLNETIRH